MKRLVLTGVLLTALGGAASAADVAVRPRPYAPPPVPVSDWTGFYIGAHGGYGWGHDSFTSTSTDPDSLTITGPNSKGGVYGFQAGYNQQWGAWVGGLEIDLSGTGIKGTNVFARGAHPCAFDPADFTCSRSESFQDKFDGLGTVRARIGFLAWPNVLFYGTGGLAWTRFVQTVDSSETIATALASQTFTSHTATPTWRFGWSAGAGVEGKIWGNWLLRVEYLHYDFGDSGDSSFVSTFTEVGFPTQVQSSSITTNHLTVDVVRVGLSYKFGGYGGPVYAAY
jgi:outer membrane immunogenic protein